MATKLFQGQEDDAKARYEEVRADDNDTAWVAFKYEGKVLEFAGSGNSTEEALSNPDLFSEDDRVYAYLRFETGDEMSRRAKFAFVTWIGPKVGALKKAAVSTDKGFVKQIFVEFGKEFLCDTRSELGHDKILKDLEKASGAAYGTGRR